MKQYSNRLNKLGTETAFKVSESASEFIKSGKVIYPYHLGDLNIPTPENIIEAAKKALHEGKTGYVSPSGIPRLRKIISEVVGFERQIIYEPKNVVIQPGGKPVIAKFIQAIMNPGDGVLYPNPGYPIYESQIEFNGGIPLPYEFIPTSDGFMLDREKLESMIDNRTRILIYNNFQNPTGCESDIEEMEWLSEIANKYNLWVLSDEAYFNIRYSGKSKSIASFPGMKERTVILYTFSKTFSMTGWRLGAAIGPSSLMKIFEKLSVNDESCTNHFVQCAGIEALEGPQKYQKFITDKLKNRRNLLSEMLNAIHGVKVIVPDTTFYLYPDITELYHCVDARSYEDFRTIILQKTGVSFCTREHFGKPNKIETRKYIRLAYSGISIKDISLSMNVLKDFFSKSLSSSMV